MAKRVELKKKEGSESPLSRAILIAFLASVLINFALVYYFYFKKEPIKKAAPTNPLFFADDVSCENPNLKLENLPYCPDQKGLVLLPRYFPVHSIFIGYEKGISDFKMFESILEASTSSDPVVPLMVLVPQSQMNFAKKELQGFVNDRTAPLVRLIGTTSKYTIWAQDYFEIAISTRNAQMTLVDLPYSEQIGEFIPHAISMTCNASLLKQSNLTLMKPYDQMASNYGGNIEPLSEKVVLVGNNLEKGQEQILQRHIKQKLVKVKVDWLEVGHVDELFSVIPVDRKGDECPFDVIYASPDKALQLLRVEKSKNPKLTRVVGKMGGDISTQFDLWSCFSEQDRDKKCDSLLKMNTVYEILMQRNIKKIKAALSRAHRSCGVKFVPIPTLFVSANEQENYGTRLDRARTLDPNPINNILVGKNILLPAQSFKALRNHTQDVVESYGLVPKFLDGRYVHTFGGGLHCAANVRRACRPR